MKTDNDERAPSEMTPSQCVMELMDRGRWDPGTTGRVSELFRRILGALKEGGQS